MLACFNIGNFWKSRSFLAPVCSCYWFIILYCDEMICSFHFVNGTVKCSEIGALLQWLLNALRFATFLQNQAEAQLPVIDLFIRCSFYGVCNKVNDNIRDNISNDVEHARICFCFCSAANIF